MIICIGYFVTELRLIENDKLGDNVTLIMTTVWFLKNYFDIDFTDYGVSSYDIGIGFGHFAISTPDVYKLVEDIRAKGGVVTREPGPVKGGQSVITFVKDDGYVFELIQRGPTLEPLRQVMLRVGDLETAGTIYFKRIFAHGCVYFIKTLVIIIMFL
ncbi:lactoylglutathione lyase glx1 [Quercus suber]|uniref:Lactoylglutathione lyase glx1 n=1 Tax=Quercus suber TaxID=58331 RepID=A0AAW0KLN4_QUESU